MPVGIKIEMLIDHIRSRQGFTRLDPSITEPTLQAIRREFESSEKFFDRYRAVCAQIGASESAEWRAILVQARDAFESQTLATTIVEIQDMCCNSAEDAWRAWIAALAEVIPLFRIGYAARIADAMFSFSPSHVPLVQAIRAALQWMRQSRWEEAYEQIEFLSRQEFLPTLSRARLMCLAGQIQYWRFSNLPRTRALFGEAEKMVPGDGVVLYSWGDYWLAENTEDKAVAYYQRAIEGAPKMANGYIGMGDRFESDEHLSDEQQVKQAEEWYRKSIRLAGGDALGYDRLIRLLGRSSLLSNRETEFQSLLKTRLAVDPEGEYDIYLDVGTCYAKNKRASEARDWYQKAIALEKSWPRAYRLLADLCRDEGDEKRAREFAGKAIEVAPECSEGYFCLAQIYEEHEAWTDALEIYKKFPQRPRVWANQKHVGVGRMQAKLKNYAQAETVLKAELLASIQAAQAENVAPEDVISTGDVTRALAALEEIADTYYEEGDDSDGARRLFGEILKMVGDRYNATYHNRLGNIHYYAEEYQAASEQYVRAIAFAPQIAVYHHNLSGAYNLLEDYDAAELELDKAYEIDGDEVQLREKKAVLANARGNRAYERQEYETAIGQYKRAVAQNPTNLVYHTNIADAWQHVNTPGRRIYALQQAIQAYEGAQAVSRRQDFAAKIDRLRLRTKIAESYGERALDFINLVTPLAVEVAPDLVPYVEGNTPERMSPELASEVSMMRARVLEQLGVDIPGIRFRANEKDLGSGGYVIFINEIPVIFGYVSPELRFCPVNQTDISGVGIKAEAGVDPVSGRGGVWIDRSGWATVESHGWELWSIMQYVTRHVEAVVRKNIRDFIGYQEVINLSDSSGVLPQLRESLSTATALTATCKALVAEEVPLTPFADLCTEFKDSYSNRIGVRKIVERIRSLPSFRGRLPGNDGEHQLLRLSSEYEEELRCSLYERDRRAILAMEPERCQVALKAVRYSVKAPLCALVAEDANLRPFVRKLVELEFPNVHVLSLAELRTGLTFHSGNEVTVDRVPAAKLVDFRTPFRVSAAEGPRNESARASLATSDVHIEVAVGEQFDKLDSGVDQSSISEMFSYMQETLFYELGILLPKAQLRTDPNLNSSEFRINLNGEETSPITGMGPHEFLVNDTVERLKLLKIDGRRASSPAASWIESSVVEETSGQAETCVAAGLTVWGPRAYIVLSLEAEIRKSAARFQTDETTKYALDLLSDGFPDLVQAVLQRYSIDQVASVLRHLVAEEISIRDLPSILDILLLVDGTTDIDFSRFIVFFSNADFLCADPAARSTSQLAPAQLADFVRASLKRYISYKYTRGGITLVVYLLDPAIEERIGQAGDQPLSEAEARGLLAAIRSELHMLPPTASGPVLLTNFGIRRSLRELIYREFPQLAVLSYQEVSPDINIQPLARISWKSPQFARA